MNAKPRVRIAGTVQVKASETGKFIVRLPNGTFAIVASAASAKRVADGWAKRDGARHPDAMNVALIEWDGCAPPAER